MFEFQIRQNDIKAGDGPVVRCRIKEGSWLARVAAWSLGSDSVAMVIGRTVYLHNASRAEFLSNPQWVRHELKHVEQFREHGFIPFAAKYLWELLRKGYQRNKYEAEARLAESDEQIESRFLIEE